MRPLANVALIGFVLIVFYVMLDPFIILALAVWRREQVQRFHHVSIGYSLVCSGFPAFLVLFGAGILYGVWPLILAGLAAFGLFTIGALFIWGRYE